MKTIRCRGERSSLTGQLKDSRSRIRRSWTFLIWHSQTVITFQPLSINSRFDLASRAMFASNFSDQNPLLVFGVDARPHPSCRCQKHPWTSTTVLCLGRTMSGRPGRSGAWSRNLYPIACNKRRTTISGFVFLPRTARMLAERAGSTRSDSSRSTAVIDRVCNGRPASTSRRLPGLCKANLYADLYLVGVDGTEVHVVHSHPCLMSAQEIEEPRRIAGPELGDSIERRFC